MARLAIRGTAVAPASYFDNPEPRYDGAAEWPGLPLSPDRTEPSFRDRGAA